MGIKICLLVTGICSVCATAAFAQCQTINTSDFQGSVCTSASGEQRSGIWFDEKNGQFEGNSQTVNNASGTKTFNKAGRTISLDLDGNISYSETRDTYGKIVTIEQFSGVEKLPDGSSFEGNWQLNKAAAGNTSLNKSGRIIGPAADGNIAYSETKDTTGKVASTKQFSGVERLPDGGIFVGNWQLNRDAAGNTTFYKSGQVVTATFDGNIDYSETKNASGLVSSIEQLSGTWRISATQRLKGNMQINRSTSGTVTVYDRRYQG